MVQNVCVDLISNPCELISPFYSYQVAWKTHTHLHDANTEAETVCPILLPSLLDGNAANQSPMMPLYGLMMPFVCSREGEKNGLPVTRWLKWPSSVSVICCAFEGQRYYGRCPHWRQMALRLCQGRATKCCHNFCSWCHCKHRTLRNGS